VRTGYADADHHFGDKAKRFRIGSLLPQSGNCSERGTWQRPALNSGRAGTAVTAYSASAMTFSLRKEVIQPQVLLRLPCYDFTPIMSYTLDGCSLAVSSPASSTAHFRDVTGGVYKARERIHRGVLIRDY
jgi:hypothetical protein